MFDIFKRFDMLGKEIRFESGKKHRFTSIIGGILTILVILAIITLAFMFGSEVWERKIPRTNISANFLERSKISLREYPLMVSFHRYDGSGVPDVKNVFNFDSIHFKINNNAKPTITSRDLIKKCDPNDYADNKKEYVTKLLDQYKDATYDLFCIIDDGLYFENGYTMPDSAFIQIEISICEEKNKRVCSSKTKEITNNQMFITFWFLDSTPSPDNYTEPIKFFTNRLTDEISAGLTTVKNLRFTKNVIISDEGWLLENKKEYEYVMLKSYQTNYVIKGGDNKLIYTLILESPNLRDEISRNYTKIQDICAQIGGIANFLIIFMEIFTSHYFEFKYKFYLFSFIHPENNIQDFLSTNLNEENKESLDISKFKINKLKEENSRINLITLSNNLQINEVQKNEEQVNENNNTQKQPQNINIPEIYQLNPIPNVLDGVSKNKNENNISDDSFDLSKISNSLEDYESYYEYIISFICCNKHHRYVLSKIIEKADQSMSLEKYLNIVKFTT